MTVEQARATLPGQTSVDFTGALAGRGTDALLEGALKVVSDGSRRPARLVRPRAAGVAAGRLRTLSLDSRLTLDASARCASPRPSCGSTRRACPARWR